MRAFAIFISMALAVGYLSAVHPRSAVLIVVGVGLLVAIGRVRHFPAQTLLLAGLMGSVWVGFVQARTGLFVSNADSLVYERLATVVAGTQGSDFSLVVPSGFRGIVLVDLLVLELEGPPAFASALSLLASFARMGGAVFVYNAVAPRLSGKMQTRVAAALAFSPSLVFFGSQNLKEPFLIFGVGACYWASQTSRRGRFIVALCGLLLCALMRPYIGVLIAAAFVGGVILNRRAKPPSPWLLGAVAAALVLMAVRFGPAMVGVDIQQQREFSVDAGGGSVMSVLAPIQIIFPWAPWVTPGSLGQGTLYLESLAQGAMLLVMVIGVRRVESKSAGDAFAVLVLLAAFVIYGLALANAGTLIRERSPFLPVLIASFALFIQTRMRPAAPPEALDSRPAKSVNAKKFRVIVPPVDRKSP